MLANRLYPHIAKEPAPGRCEAAGLTLIPIYDIWGRLAWVMSRYVGYRRGDVYDQSMERDRGDITGVNRPRPLQFISPMLVSIPPAFGPDRRLSSPISSATSTENSHRRSGPFFISVLLSYPVVRLQMNKNIAYLALWGLALFVMVAGCLGLVIAAMVPETRPIMAAPSLIAMVAGACGMLIAEELDPLQ